MTKQKQDELELLEDTINHYTIHNRGYDGSSCTYLDTHTRRKCAIGRLLTDEECVELNNKISTIDDFFTERKYYLDNLLFDSIHKKLSKYSEEFLVWLQNLHDDQKNWDEHGLTVDGKHQVDLYKLEHLYD